VARRREQGVHCAFPPFSEASHTRGRDAGMGYARVKGDDNICIICCNMVLAIANI
jgi:hypothetical protein